MPTPLQGGLILCTLAAFGLGAKAIQVSGRTSETLAQTTELLAVNTRGASAGRLAADQLESQARAETASVLAAQDAARRAYAAQAAQGAPYGGMPMTPAYTPQPYPQSQDAAPATGFQLPFFGRPSAPAPQAASPAAQGTLGYTLPSSQAQNPGLQPPASTLNPGAYASQQH